MQNCTSELCASANMVRPSRRRCLEEFAPFRVEVKGMMLCRGIALAYFMSALRAAYTLIDPPPTVAVVSGRKENPFG